MTRCGRSTVDESGRPVWARALAMGAALVTLGGAVLDVDPALREPVGVVALVSLLVLVVGWRHL